MKKYFNYLGIIAAAAMTLVSCAKEADNFTAEEPIKDGGDFSIVANPATKTVATPTASGATIAWDDDDAMNLYHAENGSATYSADGEFTIDSANPASGNFTGTVSGTLSETKAYDWYAFYPYVGAKYSPAATDKGYTPVGSKTNTTQEQTGSDSKAHLSGDNYPLYGKVTGVAYNETPVFEMHHLCSYLEVVVTNSAADELVVNEVTFTAPEDIIGTFYISFADPSNIQYVSSGASYTSDTAVLSVTGSTIPVGGSAKYYIGIKPFTAAAGADFKVSVNGYEKTIHTTKANTFQSGKIKTVNFDYDAAPDPYSWVKTPIGSLVAGDVIVIVDEGSSRALSTANGSSAAPVASSVTISSNKLSSTPADDLQFVLEVPSAGNYSFKAINTTNYLYTTGSNNGVRVGTNDNKVFEWEDGYLKNVATSRYVGVYNNQDWRCYTSINANIQDTQTAFYKKTLVGPSTPQPSVSLVKDSIDDVPAAGVDAELESDVYTLTDADDTDITVTVDGTIVTDATAADGDVLYSVAANTGAARSGWIKIAVAGGNTVQIDVNQLGASVGTPSSETITFEDLELSNGVQYPDPFDGGHFTITFAGGGNDGKYYTTGSGIRTYGGGTITVASTLTISEIEFIWSGASYAPSADVASPSGYSTSTNKWTGSSKSVVLTRPSGSGHWRLQRVTVTYE